MRSVTVSVYFMWEWWERYFHRSCPRPASPSDEALADMYLRRKRFLFENFGSHGIGEENPVLDSGFVDLVIRWGMDFIPRLLGCGLTCQEGGGYAARPLSRDRISVLEPVDVAETEIGSWIHERAGELKRIYGTAECGMDCEGPVNQAVRIRGESFYMDLLDDEDFALRFLEVCTETIILAYRFLGKEFDLKELLIANCNATLMSPELYRRLVLPSDRRLAALGREVTGKVKAVRLHHCDVPVDPFLPAYATIPEVGILEASYASDLGRVEIEMEGVSFSAMVNPSELAVSDLSGFRRRLLSCLSHPSVSFLDLWNIDPRLVPGRFASILDVIEAVCGELDCEPRYSVIPFCWDEIEWAFPVYQSG